MKHCTLDRTSENSSARTAPGDEPIFLLEDDRDGVVELNLIIFRGENRFSSYLRM